MTESENGEGLAGIPPDGARNEGAPAVLEPTLRAFYSAARPKAVDWLRLLKQQRVAVFAAEDIGETLNGIDALDPVLQKTMQLADARNAPLLVHRWVDRLLAALLKGLIGEAAEGPVIDERRVPLLLAAPGFDLRAKDKKQRRRAENLLRLLIGQHLEGRRHLLGPILLALGGALASPGKGRNRSLAQQIERKLRKAGVPALETMGAIWAFAREQEEELRGERDRLRVDNGRLERLVVDRQAEIDDQSRRRADAEARITALTSEMAGVRRGHAEQLQVVHHQAADLRDKARTFLDGRLRSLLEDALAGVEIAGSDAAQTKMALGVAVDRLQAAVKAIREEVEWLKSSA